MQWRPHESESSVWPSSMSHKKSFDSRQPKKCNPPNDTLLGSQRKCAPREMPVIFFVEMADRQVVSGSCLPNESLLFTQPVPDRQRLSQCPKWDWGARCERHRNRQSTSIWRRRVHSRKLTPTDSCRHFLSPGHESN